MFAPVFSFIGGLRPAEPPYTSARGGPAAPRRGRGLTRTLVRGLHCVSGGFAPPTPPTRPLPGAPLPRAAAVGSLATLVRLFALYFSSRTAASMSADSSRYVSRISPSAPI